jgi:exonuclease III
LKTVARELGKYRLDLVCVQEVRWEKRGTERAEGYTFFCGQGNGHHQLGTGFLYIRESYQPLGKWSLLVLGCRI